MLLANSAPIPTKASEATNDTGNVDTGSIGPPTTAITSRLKDNLVRAGLNYRFPVAW